SQARLGAPLDGGPHERRAQAHAQVGHVPLGSVVLPAAAEAPLRGAIGSAVAPARCALLRGGPAFFAGAPCTGPWGQNIVEGSAAGRRTNPITITRKDAMGWPAMGAAPPEPCQRWRPATRGAPGRRWSSSTRGAGSWNDPAYPARRGSFDKLCACVPLQWRPAATWRLPTSCSNSTTGRPRKLRPRWCWTPSTCWP